jgi:pimeloyl-ACP methyl ester carboxylesterase
MKWVFLRGLVREQRHWGGFTQLFASEMGLSMGDIMPLDLPGIGTERARAYPSSMKKVMEDVRRRAQIPAGEKVAIFSMSLGSMCAIEWAAAYPEEIEGLVAVNASASNLSSWRKRLTWHAAQAFARVLKTNDAFEREKAILKLTSNLRDMDLDLARDWARFSPAKAEFVSLALKQLATAARFKAPDGIQVPALVLSSASDRLLDPSCSVTLARRLGGESQVHLTAGHDLPLDDSQWVIRTTKEWAVRSVQGSL